MLETVVTVFVLGVFAAAMIAFLVIIYLMWRY